MVPVTYSDISEAGMDEDFAELKIANDHKFLFLKLSFHNCEHLLQDFNSIRLYIDTDNNNRPELSIHGIGG